MNEFELIRYLTKDLPGHPSVVAGVGEDCAVLDLGLPDRYLLFKTDAVVEGVHFTPETAPEQIGHKALARCLSDIAAMAGTPSHALVTLGLDPAFQPDRIRRVYQGLSNLAQRCGVVLVGGETTTTAGHMMLSIALLGTVPKNRCLRRGGARAGDGLFVTGELGGSGAGKHLIFEPRLTEARWLANHFDIHAMIDLSDGLAGDLPHILQASHVGAELMASSIPISPDAKRLARSASSHKSPLAAALTDGEDFELLFTIASRDAVPLLDQWKSAFPLLRLTCIGKILAQPGLQIRDQQGLRPLTDHGYAHFQ